MTSQVALDQYHLAASWPCTRVWRRQWQSETTVMVTSNRAPAWRVVQGLQTFRGVLEKRIAAMHSCVIVLKNVMYMYMTKHVHVHSNECRVSFWLADTLTCVGLGICTKPCQFWIVETCTCTGCTWLIQRKYSSVSQTSVKSRSQMTLIV